MGQFEVTGSPAHVTIGFMPSSANEPPQILGGAAGGLFAVWRACGRGIVTVLVGSRLATEAGVVAYVFVGGGVTSALAGGAIAALLDGMILIGVGIGVVAGIMLSALLLTLAKHPGVGDNWRPEWQQKLRITGISAHDIAKVADYDSKTLRFYEKQFELNRDDGMSVRDAHDAAVLATEKR
jgi:hypothetical protein